MEGDVVVLLPSFLNGIHVNYGHVEVAQLVEELVINLPGYPMPLSHRKLRGDIHEMLRRGLLGISGAREGHEKERTYLGATALLFGYRP
jgi:hypothetical protein